MPFIEADLMPLIQTARFSMWHYRTTDVLATVTAPGYFSPAAARLSPSDLMIMEAANAMSMLPVRSNAAVGPGVQLDGAVAPIALVRTVAQTFRMVQAAGAVVSSIILAPLMAGVIMGTSIPVEAQVIGPISQVVVTLFDSSGQIVPPTQTVNVDQGYAITTLPTPAVGTGYRIRIEDVNQTISATSRSFNILPDLRLVVLEEGGTMLQEDGFALAQN